MGSIKPYAFDCYLGILGQSVINSQDDSSSDPVILAAVALALTIGVLSSQLATNVYNEMRAEEMERFNRSPQKFLH